MKKNKAKRHQQQRQKKALKDARRRAAMRKPPPRTSREAPPLSDEQFAFWLAHGVNYMASDYAEATWTPVLEGLYEGKSYSKEDILEALTAKYGVDGLLWPMEAKAAFAWILQGRAVVQAYVHAAIKSVEAKDPAGSVGDSLPEELVLLPHNGTVWELFDSLKKTIVSRNLA